MLQWTSRLRDALVAHGCELRATDEADFSLCEAEFASTTTTRGAGMRPSASSPSLSTAFSTTSSSSVIDKPEGSFFPADFSWDVFLQCYQKGMGRLVWFHDVRNNEPTVRPVSTIPIPPSHSHPPGTVVTSLDKHRIDVLWLSPFVFTTSSHLILPNYRCHRVVHLEMREPDVRVSLHVYSSVDINADAAHPSSTNVGTLSVPDIAFHFLRHLVAPLPVDFFANVQLLAAPEMAFDSSPEHLLQSLIPFDTSPRPSSSSGLQKRRNDELTSFRWSADFDCQQLPAMLAQRFNPYIRVDLRHLWVPSQVVARRELLNAALRESPHVRHLGAPVDLTSFEDSRENPSFATNPHLQSLALVVNGTDLLATTLLDGIRHNAQLTALHLEMSTTHFARNIRRVCRRVLNGNRTLQELTVTVQSHRDSAQCYDDFTKALTVCCPQGWGLDFIGFRRVFERASRPMTTSSLLWDQTVAPRLAVNWYHRHGGCQSQLVNDPEASMASPSSTGEDTSLGWIPLAIEAIDRGQVSRHTSRLKSKNPMNLSLATPSVIYDIVRQHTPGWLASATQ